MSYKYTSLNTPISDKNASLVARIYSFQLDAGLDVVIMALRMHAQVVIDDVTLSSSSA